MTPPHFLRTAFPRLAVLALSALALGFAGGSPPSGFAPPGLTSTEVSPSSPGPGLHLQIVSVKGGSAKTKSGSAKGKSFSTGNKLKIKFKLTKDDGEPWDIAQMDTARIMVSGPTINYQRVIAEQNDLGSKAKWNKKDGTWNYKFTQGLPKTYLPPLNDSDSFGVPDGELKGQALLAGTYTVGMYVTWKYTVDGAPFQLADDATADFLFGGATDLLPREVVGKDNCNLCHDTLQAHDGSTRSPALCVLCHTAGSEDRNDPDVAGGTPGVSVEFRVMIHKIHNGTHLPSVNGVTTNSDGSRNYAALPQPYLLVAADNTIHDFSHVKFPVYPNSAAAMPKDLGYSALTAGEKAQEDVIRTGITKCDKCHGDPDGDGPLQAPLHGDLHQKEPDRNACASCHDDVDYNKDYSANGFTMFAGSGFNTACNECHSESGQQLAVVDSHLHPLEDPTLNKGLVVDLTGITGGSGAGGRFLPGDSPALTFSLKGNDGLDVEPVACDAASVMVAGPSNGRQAVMPYPGAAAIAASPFDFGGRLASASATGKGTMGKVIHDDPAVAETITVQFVSPNSFAVRGSVSGNLGTGDLAALASTNPPGSSVSSLVVSNSAAPQHITIAFTSSTHFTITGSLTGTIGSGNLPAATNTSARFKKFDGTLSFIVSVGDTPFAFGNSVFATVFRGSDADPVTFPILAGSVPFSGTAPAPDRFYAEVIPAAPSYTLTVPMDLTLEYLGDGNGSAGQALAAANLPVTFGRQTLWEVTALGSATTLSADAAPLDRFIDVTSTSGYALGDTVALDTAAGVGTREYAAVSWVESPTRMWLATPLRYAHPSGVAVAKATLSFRQEGSANQYKLNDAAGTVTSVVPFGSGDALVMSYRTAGRFGYRRHPGDALQASYVPPVNDSNALGEDWGDWGGKSLVDGTYTASLWISRNIDLFLDGELQTYHASANAADIDFLFGAGSTQIEPQDIISSEASCNACHDGLSYHGNGSASLTACLMCHQPGAEDRSQYAVNAAPPTTGVTIDFRTMLHKIHMGSSLAKAGTYEVVGSGPPPDNFAVATFGDVIFPSMPGGALNCDKCHGAGSDSWKEPKDRTHPDQLVPTRVWRAACNSCHDSDSATGHIDLQTTAAGVETCDVCHGKDDQFSVEKMHVVR